LPWPTMFQGLDGIIAEARVGGFVTGVVGQIDLKALRLDLVSAGHHVPSLLVGGRPVTLEPTCQTRPWGLDFECPWQVAHVELGSADWSIVCFTDGITEAVTKDGAVFGYERVAGYHQKSHSLCAEDMCQGLISEVAAQQGTGALNDDQTVLVLRSVASTVRRSSPTKEMPQLS